YKTSPSKEHRAPSPSSTSIMLKTSPIRGTLRTTQGSLVRRDAAISLRTAFFAPLTRTSPLRGVPPSTVSVGSVPLPPAWRLTRTGDKVLEPRVTLHPTARAPLRAPSRCQNGLGACSGRGRSALSHPVPWRRPG